MHLMELLLIAVGLSMDAFAVAICHGLSMDKGSFRNAAVTGMYFGAFQALMPLVGYMIGTQFADAIVAFDHWLAFLLLGFIGGKMVYESLKKGESGQPCPEQEACGPCGEGEKGPKEMLLLSLATSIDALIAGVSFAFLQVQILPASLLVGVITFFLSMLASSSS